ncbi:hypothetical protein EJB05_11263, partial [Eragrostis curvula]
MRAVPYLFLCGPSPAGPVPCRPGTARWPGLDRIHPTRRRQPAPALWSTTVAQSLPRDPDSTAQLDRSPNKDAESTWDSNLFVAVFWSMSRMVKSTVGISRRILNLIVDTHIPGIRSLCCIDLNRQKFFHPLQATSTIGGGSESVAAQISTTQTPTTYAGTPWNKEAEAAASMMEKFRLRNPTFIFKAEGAEWNIDCLPLVDRKIVCTDQSGAFLLDYDSRQVAIVPNLQKPKGMPISLFVPGAGADADQGCGRIYVMESVPKPESGCSTLPSDQFEAFFYRRPDEFWQCEFLPPPPFVRDPKYQQSHHRIESYAVVSGGSHVCISTEEAGTYCLDTASHTWSKVGEWKLPFYGKVEYVPELKLWFGLSAESKRLAAADLSTILTMDSQPQLVDEWKELDLPVQLIENQHPQLVNLGSGRFCIARFFEATAMGDGSFEQSLVVLTCVE